METWTWNSGCKKSNGEGAVIAEEIARACKPFTEGEFIKNCIEEVCDVVCPDKKQAFANISLSRNTVASWVDELASDLQIHLKTKAKEFVLYLFATDESTDRTDNAQLSIFIRGVDAQFSVTEELFEFKSDSRDNYWTGHFPTSGAVHQPNGIAVE
ncbi:General transcription factor II-I repeat domain-containing protein 2 [Merluccius polli]|uniref:General transcription factor II-I repeat domain-containing protein 2 n=1 Tax=Merluccius polli TaxID=89951 RepID=A0AA47MPM7_MERPO|nr:General transcription factor II-I repeat domain-containing protein 2 [Merluccius polli]KAK0143822.1 General transcription factor II-I repeat domain-containing protein 2 [Merluccius polli]